MIGSDQTLQSPASTSPDDKHLVLMKVEFSHSSALSYSREQIDGFLSDKWFQADEYVSKPVNETRGFKIEDLDDYGYYYTGHGTMNLKNEPAVKFAAYDYPSDEVASVVDQQVTKLCGDLQ